jgi:Planctomycete cytochrome C
MTVPVRRAPLRLRLGLLALGLILLLSALLLFFPPDGLERASWAQFIGRFHLLTVHFPIALILLVPVLEWAGRDARFSYLRSSVDFLWPLAILSVLAAATLGWCLARSGGYSGRLVTQHMWGGVSLAAACSLCWMLRGYFHGPRLAYPLALVATVGLVSWTGYRGGQLSQGENHLTEHMPVPLRKLIGLSSGSTPLPRSNPAYFYGAHVEPIFITHCDSCHGPDKQKGRLRLDTYESLMRGGKDGLVIKAGNTKGSELLRRVSLSPSDDDAMPPQGKRPLAANEIKLLELWIAAGASSTLAANGIKDAPTNEVPVVAEVTFPEIDPAAVTQSRAPLAQEVNQLKQRFPGVLDYESRGSAYLALDASALGPKFGDDDLAALKPLSAQIVTADLSRTAITDRSAPLLAAMKHARVLRLTETKITDATVSTLAGMDQLESLDLYGTAVTPACMKVVENLPKLRHLYAGATKIPADTSVSDALKNKLVF